MSRSPRSVWCTGYESLLLAATIIATFVFSTFAHKGHYLARSAFTLLAVLYIGKLVSYFIAIRGIPEVGMWLTLYAIFIIALTDIFAMLVGVAIGKHPLTRISPRKTVEGSIGGLLAGIGVGIAFGMLPQIGFAWWQGALIGAITSIAAQAGDLVESALKRDARVKDAGSAIGSHGGVLDRFDSYIFAGSGVLFRAVDSRIRPARSLAAAVKRIAILGSTGSIGRQALDVIAVIAIALRSSGLAAGRNAELLREQAEQFEVGVISLGDDGGAHGLMRVATESGAEIVLAATDGAVAFDAVFAAVERGIDVAVANKELIVAAGELLLREARKAGRTSCRSIPSTARSSNAWSASRRSGSRASSSRPRAARFGTDRARDANDATVADALAHPTWQMGTKNTDRFRDADEQRPRGHRGEPALRDAAGIGSTCSSIARASRTDFAIFTDGNVKAQLASARHALADRLRARISGSARRLVIVAGRAQRRCARARSVRAKAKTRPRCASSGPISSGFRVCGWRTGRSNAAGPRRRRSRRQTKSQCKRS